VELTEIKSKITLAGMFVQSKTVHKVVYFIPQKENKQPIPLYILFKSIINIDYLK